MSAIDAARDAAEYDECEHGVPGGNDCVDCMKRAHADEVRALNEEAEALATERDEARADLTAIRAALGNGADEAAWRPGETMADAVGRLRGEHRSLRDVLQWVNDQCPGKCSAVCDSALRAGHDGSCAEALGDGGPNG